MTHVVRTGKPWPGGATIMIPVVCSQVGTECPGLLQAGGQLHLMMFGSICSQQGGPDAG